MRIETLSTFPQMFDAVMSLSMMRIAQEKGLLDFTAHDLRDWTCDRHRTTDDDPYGGGQGLVMKCEPIFAAYDDIVARAVPDTRPCTIFMSPGGTPFTERLACSLARADHLLFVCGHYEGIDERAYTLADRVVSLGDYVVSSGELAALVVIDAVVRKVPGVLGGAASALDESFSDGFDGLLEHPHYTRPASFRGMEVPEVLLSGNHAAIAQWRREQSLKRTRELRPDLLYRAHPRGKDGGFISSLPDGAFKEAEPLS
ncbi:MAG: tRNA (guanosine(37)-N1)-methyltransferase TrmD [Eggerthellaceae bacterium]|jgi:tRNA (guanine37-N1)-methyltransferase|nr:tRNA (guanosine(37)-N1)-methyltransferase TrmD [Eggerthellaceae bacterium]MDR2715649.1 tRNA (guanosine(37)-N1)-methyltransferase TrmD [Coriobacteriaceae bacterium]